MRKIYLFYLFAIMFMSASGQQWPPDETVIGNSYYDFQTWRAMQNRIFCFDDGTIGAVWNMGFNFPGFNDLGVGYNYFNGTNWDIYPFQSITNGKAVFPSYTKYGANGEICVSQGQNGLFINWRLSKGTGNWQQSVMNGTDLKHPVVVTSGSNNNVVHLLYLKAEAGFNPTEVQPDRGFIWYARSSDGLQTWEINQQISGLGLDEYLGFTIGAYSWAEPKNDVLAFVAGDFLTDLVLMKSYDNGNNWQKTVIWEHPYPFLEFFSITTDTFYCNNGGITVALDSEQNVHLAFGISCIISQTAPSPQWYFPEVGGLAYWKEGMNTFSDNVHALDPFGHPESELIQDYNLIGWAPDINSTLGIYSTYPTPGLIIMPEIVINESNKVYVVFNSLTEAFSPDAINYRHLWIRGSYNNGISWGEFYDLNAAMIHVFEECIYPAASAYISNNKLKLIYSGDEEPGLVLGGQINYTENHIYFSDVSVNDLTPYLIVDFAATPTTIHEGETVAFQNISQSEPLPTGFFWTFSGGTPEFSNDENPVVVYNDEGQYDVTLFVSNGLINQSLTKENFITVYPVMDANHAKENELMILPNPSDGKITITNYLKEDLSVKVINLVGKAILEQKFSRETSSINLDISNNPEGIYFVEISYLNIKTIKKLVLRR